MLVNKGQLVDTLASQFEGNRRAAKHALEAVFQTITREVARGEKVAITGFGSFEKKVRPARMVRNPRTGERSRAKKTAVPRFKAGAELKAVVSGEKKLPKATSGTAKKAAAKKSSSNGTAKKSAATKRTTSKSTGTAGKSAAGKKSTSRKKSTAKKS